jgi:hypothetical protein
MYAAVRIGGKFVRVSVSPHEANEHATNRAWWIAFNAIDKPIHERECLSHIYINEKYNGMKYNITKE